VMTPTTDMLFAAKLSFMPEEWCGRTGKKKQLLEEASKIFNALPICEA